MKATHLSALMEGHSPKISGIFERKSACSFIDLLAFLLLGKGSKYRQKFLDAGVALMNICDQA